MAYFDPFDGFNLKGTKQKKGKTKPQKHCNYRIYSNKRPPRISAHPKGRKS